MGSWGVVGLEGFLLQVDSSVPGDTALMTTLFLQHLPIIATAALLPGLALAGRVRSGILAFITFLTAGIIVPLAGGWAWDALAVRLGAWYYDPNNIVNIWIGGLPIEEWIWIAGVTLLFGCVTVTLEEQRTKNKEQ